MKSRTIRLRTLVASGCALLLSTLITPSAQADITRHCRGLYQLRVVSPTIAWYTSFPIPPFTAEGTCSAADPNRCRERARDRANRCMQANWDQRLGRFRPNECGPSHGITGYNFTDLKRMIEAVGCCHLQSPIRNTSANLAVYRHSHGERGCGTGRVLLHVQSHTVRLTDDDHYHVDCRSIRQQLCP
jgi:hypothetical protein